jgi:hypothetical protein
MYTPDAHGASPEHDQVIQSSAPLGVTSDLVREAIFRQAGAAGLGSASLKEWSSVDADEGASQDMPPLYYAALLPLHGGAEMPLGIGDSPANALIDLLWELAGPSLVEEVRSDPTGASTAQAIRVQHPPLEADAH